MSNLPDVLWLTVSPSLKRFDRPLQQWLSRQMTVRQWEYCQDPDEAMSLEVALVLLHDYLKASAQPVHLVGHSTGGLLGLLYARRHPERVRSLTLLSVGVHAAINWHAHYYAHRKLLSCSRHIVLAQMVYTLFGTQPRHFSQRLVKALEQDLDSSLSPHTLLHLMSIPPDGAPVPLMICNSGDDKVVDPNEFLRWHPWLKANDRLWQCPAGGGHFFHFFHPEVTGAPMLEFWRSLQPSVAITGAVFER